MYRQSPSRNQRSKGIKVKYVLQICLLLAVCCWLIYQVKHSHDKKKEFEESDAKASLQGENSDEIMKLGRKDIVRPRDDETTSKNDKQHDEPIDEEDTIEEDENKPEEDEPEEKNVEENSDDHEQENSDREEDSVDENETQEVESEDGRGQTEREEHYKADDASSAVTHDTLTDIKENNTEETNTGEGGKDLEVENGEIGGDDRKSKVTTGETKVDVLDGLEDGSPPNNTVIEGSVRDLASNGSAEVKIENDDLLETKPELDRDSQAIATNNSFLNDGTNGFDSNSTGSVETKDAELHPEDFSNSSNNNNTESSSKKNDEIETEKSHISDGTYENSESTVTENPEEEVQHDGIDASDTSNSMEEKHVHTDLDTLPEIQTEGSNSEDDVAAE